MEFFDARKVAFQSKVDSYGERQNTRAPIPQSVTLRAEEVARDRRAILKQWLDLGGSRHMTANPEAIHAPSRLVPKNAAGSREEYGDSFTHSPSRVFVRFHRYTVAGLAGLDPEDAPLMLRDSGTEHVYSLAWIAAK